MEKRPVTRLALHLMQADIRQTELADLAGIQRPTVNQIVRGQRVPTPDQRRRIASALGMDMSTVFEPLTERGDDDRVVVDAIKQWLAGAEGELFLGRLARAVLRT